MALFRERGKYFSGFCVIFDDFWGFLYCLECLVIHIFIITSINTLFDAIAIENCEWEITDFGLLVRDKHDIVERGADARSTRRRNVSWAPPGVGPLREWWRI